MVRPEELTLAINAGGRGRRLGGVAKGLLEVGGQPILARLLGLRPLAREVILVANDAAVYRRFGLRTVPDEVPDRGAPGGVVTALGAASTPWVLVVACDAPFLTPEVVAPLLDAVDASVDVVCATRASGIEPLPGVYRRALHPAWRDALSQQPALRDLVRASRLRLVEVADPRALDSLNTPEDLALHGAR